MKIIVAFSLLVFLASCQPKDLPTVFTQSEGYAMMKISHETTKTELEQMSVKLAKQGIKIVFSSSEFFEDGKIRNLKLGVETPDGNRGSTSADLVVLQFKYYGFIYQKDGNPVFQIGNI